VRLLGTLGSQDHYITYEWPIKHVTLLRSHMRLMNGIQITQFVSLHMTVHKLYCSGMAVNKRSAIMNINNKQGK